MASCQLTQDGERSQVTCYHSAQTHHKHQAVLQIHCNPSLGVL